MLRSMVLFWRNVVRLSNNKKLNCRKQKPLNCFGLLYRLTFKWFGAIAFLKVWRIVCYKSAFGLVQRCQYCPVSITGMVAAWVCCARALRLRGLGTVGVCVDVALHINCHFSCGTLLFTEVDCGK